MTTTIGSLDLGALSDLREDVTQYFWFESNSSSAWGSGAHVTLYPESQFTNPNNANYMKGQNILMNTDGLSIRNGALPMMVLDNDSLDFNIIDTTNNTYTNAASFGAVSTIGVTDNTQSYMQLDYHSFQMIDKEGNPYVYMSDLRNDDGEYLVSGTTFVANGSSRIFNLNFNATNVDYTVSVSDSSGGTITKRVNQVIFSTAPTEGAIITIGDYYTKSPVVKAFTLGRRGSNPTLGAMSFVSGYSNNASGNYSHAEGYNTEVLGNGAAHVEGYYTTANGSGAHAGGTYSNAMGDSFAHGYHVSAPSTNSFVIGSYNIEDNSGGMASAGEYLFTIGNGTSENNRSNALTVAWDSTVAFADPSKTFVVTTETFSYPAISNGSGSGVRTATFSKSGYYPVGVMGFRTGNRAAVPTRLNLSSRSSGSAGLSYVLRAVAAVSAGSGDVDILWIKIT